MRVLVTACPAASHFHPLVPFARAARAAGHEVLVAIGGGFARRAADSGLTVHAVGGQVDLLSAAPLGGGGRSGWARMVALAERTADDLLALARWWRPDVVVRTPPEFAGPLVAEVLGVPVVEHSFGLVMPRERLIAAERRSRSCTRGTASARACPTPTRSSTSARHRSARRRCAPGSRCGARRTTATAPRPRHRSTCA
ncbi:hypothetical protein ACFQV2_11165 [Actinokineospora soli]|uniref:Erythromycin biosynthesis protein CIII-like N-terminal domain-containing protein n=1 Tax=Actinokineospora soli TaxID=1048753 RepID=A0ABW2TJW6_9PSEU